TVLIRGGKLGDPYRDTKADKTDDAKDEKTEARPDEKEAIKKILAAVDGVQSVADLYSNADGTAFSLSTSKDCRAEVGRAVIDAKLDLLQLDFARSELESTFIRLVGG